MLVIPAVDLKGGRCVRLREGRAEAETLYSEDPVAMALRWQAEGAPWLHIVNLDGAFGQASANLTVLGRILKAVQVPVQFGGGMRDLPAIREVLDLGVRRAILGTAAITNPALVRVALERFGPERVAVGIDAREGRVATHGWTEATHISAMQLALDVKALGVERVIFTDIARDGMLTGPNIQATQELAEGTGLKVIASGGISSLADIRALAELEPFGVEGCIIGKALYEGKVGLREAIDASRGDR